MKVAIITHPLRHNYGGILQNYALQQVLKGMGHDVTTLEITKTDGLTLKTRLSMALRRMFYKCVDKNGRFLHIWSGLTSEQKLSANTWRFIGNNISVRRINGYPNESEYEAYVVGSDQVWRPRYFDTDIAYLAFTKDFQSVKRLAYAASFGTDQWEYSSELTEKCKLLVRRFNAVSVREESGVRLCKDNLKIDATHVLDPTMLLGKDEYLNSLGISAASCSKGIFYYFLDDNKNKKALVNKMQKTKGCECFTVNSRVEDVNAPLQDRIQPPIEDWIRAFEESSFVITDSFHGSVFSMIFNKPFIVVGNEDRGLSRFDSILSLFNQQFRLITEKDIEHLDMSVFSKAPNIEIEAMRINSFDFLKKNL